MPPKATTTLQKKLLFARILQWLFLALAVLPPLVLWRLMYLASQTPESGMYLIFVVPNVLPVPLFALLGFTCALEWKQGLQERIRKQEVGENNVA